MQTRKFAYNISYLMANPTTAIILDSRKVKKNGTYPVKLRITFERKQKYFPTPHNLTELEFKKVMFAERQNELQKKLKKQISAFENRATGIIEGIPVFSWQAFEGKYFSNRLVIDSLNDAFEVKIAQYKEAGRIGTAVTYDCAKKSLEKFAPNAKFSEITPDLLAKYEKTMLDNGNSKTTVGIYLRSLRSLFNFAISENPNLSAAYPFSRNVQEKNKYRIPKGSNIKKALELSDIEKIFNYKAKAGSSQERSKDYWIFSYLTNGLNLKDLCLLQYKNIDGDMLKFIRAKTANQREEKTIQAILQPETKEIIKRWGNKKKDGNTYIFPVLNGKETPERERQLVQQLIHVINDNMKIIANELEITKPVTTYAARHSFSTVLKRSGASMEVISEMLGHSNLTTTKRYLDSFESDTLKHTAKALTNFI